MFFYLLFNTTSYTAIKSSNISGIGIEDRNSGIMFVRKFDKTEFREKHDYKIHT